MLLEFCLRFRFQFANRPSSGSGRTTFVNTLCGKQVLEGKDADDAANAHIEEGVHIKPVTVGKFERRLDGCNVREG